MMGQADKDGTNSLDIIEFLQESSFSHYHDVIFMVIIIRCLIDVIVTLTNYIINQHLQLMREKHRELMKEYLLNIELNIEMNI